jgi:hypothetical protein
LKPRDDFAVASRTARRRSLNVIGTLMALLCAVSFMALLGTETPAAEADTACPNEAIRIAQQATHTGGCRAWEQVSPAEKGDGDIIAEGLKTMASALGDAAVFESRFNFGDSIGSGTVGRTTYLARRGDGGWSTHSITPMPRPDTIQVLFASNRVEILAEDLSNAILWAYDLPAVTDDMPLQENVYAEDTATGALRTINKSQVDPPTFRDFLNTSFAGYSADAKHLAFGTGVFGEPPTALLPDARAGVPNVYKWDDGVLSVAGKLPDGSVPPTGAGVAVLNKKGAMSADGSRLVFTASPDGSAPSQLYLHVDGAPSVWVSEPELSDEDDEDKSPPGEVVFEGMTPDGKNVFFTSFDPLLDEDTAPGADLYRFTYSPDAESDDNLTLITNNGSSRFDTGTGGVLVGMSDDATRVYVHQIDALLKLWEQGVPGLKVVDPTPFRVAESTERLTLLSSEPGHGRVSPDGNWLAYIDGQHQMYLYSRSSQSLTCVSCPATATLRLTITNSGVLDLPSFRPRFLSDDGQVFFTSTGSLVPEDTNGVADVYEYDGPTGRLSLVTSGTGSEPSMFADAGRDGDDVFFVTRQQLAPSDTDEYADLYDARAGGGFDEPRSSPTVPCAGDVCQVAASGLAAAPAIPSRAPTRGNLRKGRVHCAANQRKVRRKGKVRCVKRHHKHHRGRAAGAGRGARK